MAQATEITITMPREAFDQAREVFKTIGQAFDAAAEKIKADEKLNSADQKGQALMDKLSPEDPLAGFGDQLSAASNQGLGSVLPM